MDHACIAVYVPACFERINDAVDVSFAEPILRTVLGESSRRVDHEDAFAVCRVFFVEDDNAGGNPCSVEQVRGQSDDGFYVATLDELLSYFCLNVASEQNSVGHDDSSAACRL